VGFRLVHPSLLGYRPGFLSSQEQRDVLGFLESVPVVEPEQRDVTSAFAFSAPRAGAIVVQGRREAAAGWPVWADGGPVSGVAVPGPLAALAERVGTTLGAEASVVDCAGAELPPFTSVYADRYPVGGSFFPHTDRDCYGPVVAGVSVGPGSCRITFECEGAVEVDQVLEPGSLYVFAGRLRDIPYVHRISEVTDLRFGVTYRSASTAAEATRTR
jgi:hypothetical protein